MTSTAGRSWNADDRSAAGCLRSGLAVADVSTAVNFGRDNGLLFSCAAVSHKSPAAPWPTAADARHVGMKEIGSTRNARCATAQPGCLWSDLDAATQGRPLRHRRQLPDHRIAVRRRRRVGQLMRFCGRRRNFCRSSRPRDVQLSCVADALPDLYRGRAWRLAATIARKKASVTSFVPTGCPRRPDHPRRHPCVSGEPAPISSPSTAS